MKLLLLLGDLALLVAACGAEPVAHPTATPLSLSAAVPTVTSTALTATSDLVTDFDPTSTPDALAGFKQAADGGASTWAFDAGQQVTNAYQVRALDTTPVLDAEGHVVYSDAYPTTYGVLKDTLTGHGL